MRKNKKKNYLMLLLLLVLGVTVGYAFLSTTLNINGTTVIKDAKWNVYWDNPVVTTGSVTTTVPTIDSAKTTATYDITLNNPKDYYEFTIDAVNAGTIDAMIKVNGVSNKVYSDSGRTEETTLPAAIKYTVTYADGTTIAEKHLLAKKQGNTPTRETYKVRIEYRNDEQTTAQDLEAITEETTYYMTFSVEYVQADDTAEEVVHGLTETRYRTLPNNGVYIGDNVSTGVTLFDTVAEAKAAFSNRPFYLKHELENDIVKESYVCFEKDSNTYCLRGFQTYDNSTGSYIPEYYDSEKEYGISPYYESNKTILKNAFGESNCTQNSSSLDCSGGGLRAIASESGYVDVYDGSAGCYVRDIGDSDCFEW